jgi:hypothetical protein
VEQRAYKVGLLVAYLVLAFAFIRYRRAVSKHGGAHPSGDSPFANGAVSKAMPVAATLHKVLGSALLAPSVLEFRAGPRPEGLLEEE